jgi:hypothetical protein
LALSATHNKQLVASVHATQVSVTNDLEIAHDSHLAVFVAAAISEIEDKHYPSNSHVPSLVVAVACTKLPVPLGHEKHFTTPLIFWQVRQPLVH